MLLSKVDEWGKVAWLTITVAAFWIAWPIGLLVVAYLAGSGRLHAWRTEASEASGAWFGQAKGAAGRGRAAWGAPRGSGNKAFDEYREATLRRLEDEQREFQSFLERLRQARDKSEFDAFMAEQRQRGGGGEVSGDGAGPAS